MSKLLQCERIWLNPSPRAAEQAGEFVIAIKDSLNLPSNHYFAPGDGEFGDGGVGGHDDGR